jgi:integrase
MGDIKVKIYERVKLDGKWTRRPVPVPDRRELLPGCFNCEIRVESKPQWKYQTKTGTTRNVSVSKELMDRLLRRKAEKRPSKLQFGTSKGKPDYRLWDRLKAIAKRAGLDPTTVWVHKMASHCGDELAALEGTRRQGMGHRVCTPATRT